MADGKSTGEMSRKEVLDLTARLMIFSGAVAIVGGLVAMLVAIVLTID